MCVFLGTWIDVELDSTVAGQSFNEYRLVNFGKFPEFFPFRRPEINESRTEILAFSEGKTDTNQS